MPVSIFTHEQWRVVNDGMGQFLCPPNEAHYRFSVLEGYGHRASHYSLDGALQDEFAPEEIKAKVRALKERYPGDVKDEAWITQVYKYFNSCYTKDVADRSVNGENFVIYGKRWGVDIDNLIAMGITPLHHLGYLCIKQHDPAHEIRMEHLTEWE